MSIAYGKPLRFASLLRVSTEKQAQKGESLSTQGKQINQAVGSLGGTITRRYAGQEHATEGYERRMLANLLADAQKSPRPFDAVVVADPSRWSRDNVDSERGLEVLKEAGVRFFVLTSEYDLYDPQHRMFLGLSSVIGAFQARVQKQKSLLNRIERVKRGVPAAGHLPFGRVWDPEAKRWGVDPEKQRLVADVARRYLAGEPMRALANEYGHNQANLTKILRERCGTAWVVDFDVPDLNMKEQVTVEVPALLPPETIRDLRLKLKVNRERTRRRQKPAGDHLLRGHIYCGACGYTMTGQANKSGVRYYRHASAGEAAHCAVLPRPWVRADRIEGQVVRDLFNMFGNPTAIARAVKDAVPDHDQMTQAMARLAGELEKVAKARSRVLDLVVKDALTDEQAEQKLKDLKEREAALRDEHDNLAAQVADVPDEETLKLYVERIEGLIFVHDGDWANQYAGGNSVASLLAMSAEDKQQLIKAVFDQPPLADGSPAGVYVYVDADKPRGRHGPKNCHPFTYRVRGRLEFDAVKSNARH